MRRLFLVALAVLFTCGIASATEIQGVVEPKNYPTVWTETVYNGSGAAISSGTIVEWDFETSDSTINWYDDMCPWVQTADGASDIWTAGVLIYGRDLADGSVGQIIIRGPAYVLEHSTPGTANQLCGSHTDGTVTTDGAGANTAALGVVIDASPSSSGLGSGYSIVYVDVTLSDD